MIDFSEHDVATLAPALRACGLRPSHAGPLLRSFYRGDSTAASNDRQFPARIEEWLKAKETSLSAAIASRQVAADGTAKLLLRLGDGRSVESVLMPGHRADRAAGCISSQVGCAMGCDFCATAKAGFERNLTAGEIVDQFLVLRREARATGRRLQTIVFMGMGEPMLNLANVCAAIERMAENKMGGLGSGQITVSTVGIISGIDALAASGLRVNLAVSLHAPDDRTRAKLLPTGKQFRVVDILAAADRYQNATGRPVSIQYCLLQGVNDSVEQADQLAELLGGRRMHVNLLHYNPTGVSVRGETYEASCDGATEAFLCRLKGRGVVTHVRRSRGPDIEAACGQLRQSVDVRKSGTGSAP